MDERKINIQDLEVNNLADTEARNRLLEGLGEAIFRRIGEDEPFQAEVGNTPGGILADYRKLQREISESQELIKTLETEITRLKELEEEINSGEEEQVKLEKELEEVYVRLGKQILLTPDLNDFSGIFRQQEQILLAKIEEQEKKVRELEEREGNFLTWLGKNAQIAVTKAFLSKNQSDLLRVYRSTGEKAFSVESPVSSEWKSSDDAVNAGTLREKLSTVSVNLAMLRGERRQIGGLFEADISPARRIQGLEKRIAFVFEEFPGIHLRLGSLAVEDEGRKALYSFLADEDNKVLENAEAIKNKIAEREQEIAKIKASINIDNEKADIEKAKKAIAGHRLKITAAEEAISQLDKQIAESEKHIEELNNFIKGPGT